MTDESKERPPKLGGLGINKDTWAQQLKINGRQLEHNRNLITAYQNLTQTVETLRQQVDELTVRVGRLSRLGVSDD